VGIGLGDLMSDLCVIVPTRGRPQNAVRLINDWRTTEATARLLFAVDDDDPMKKHYIDVFDANREPWLKFVVGERLRLGPTLNHEAVAQAKQWDYLGFIGDDHSPKTPLWDKKIEAALKEMRTGIVYGDDKFQGINLPTAVFLTSDIVRTLGYMCPPTLIHMWLDNSWKEWGESIGRLRYLPSVVIEHLHPQADGKGQMDDNYAEVWALMEPDKVRFDAYRSSGGLGADIAKLRALI
jgi:hypothetical protein